MRFRVRFEALGAPKRQFWGVAGLTCREFFGDFFFLGGGGLQLLRS